MSMLRVIVLDVLKPHEPSILSLSKKISNLAGVDGCNIATIEIDKEVENVKISVEGTDINYSEIEKIIEESGATIHSIDKVSAGKIGKGIVEEVEYDP